MNATRTDHRARPELRFGYACWLQPASWETFAATRPCSQITLGRLVTFTIDLLFVMRPRSTCKGRNRNDLHLHLHLHLHWLRVQKRTEYTTAYKLLQFSSPRLLRDLITVQLLWCSQSSTLVILLQPSVDSSLKITNRSFRYAAPHLWNIHFPTLCVPHSFDILSPPSSSASSYYDPGALVDLTHGVTYSGLKTFLFSKSFPP